MKKVKAPEKNFKHFHEKQDFCFLRFFEKPFKDGMMMLLLFIKEQYQREATDNRMETV